MKKETIAKKKSENPTTKLNHLLISIGAQPKQQEGMRNRKSRCNQKHGQILSLIWNGDYFQLLQRHYLSFILLVCRDHSVCIASASKRTLTDMRKHIGTGSPFVTNICLIFEQIRLHMIRSSAKSVWISSQSRLLSSTIELEPKYTNNISFDE